MLDARRTSASSCSASASRAAAPRASARSAAPAWWPPTSARPRRSRRLERSEPASTLALGAPFPDAGGFRPRGAEPGRPARALRAGARARRGATSSSPAARSRSRSSRSPARNGKSTTTLLVEAMLRAAGLRARAAGNLGAPGARPGRRSPRRRRARGLVLPARDGRGLPPARGGGAQRDARPPRPARELRALRSPPRRACSRSRDPRTSRCSTSTIPPCGRSPSTPRARVVPFRDPGPVSSTAPGSTPARACSREPAARRERYPLDGAAAAGRAQPRERASPRWRRWSPPAPTRVARSPRSPASTACRTAADGGAQRAASTGSTTRRPPTPAPPLRSLALLRAPLVWIAGGRDKGLDFARAGRGRQRRVRAAVLIGEAAAKLAAALGRARARCTRAGSIDARRAPRGRARAAGRRGAARARAARASTSSASYAERGERFRAAVDALAREAR